MSDPVEPPKTEDVEEDDFEALYVETRIAYLNATDEISRKTLAFEVIQYITAGKLKHATVAKLRLQAYAELKKPTLH